MNLSLAHPSFCGCLPCEERRKGSQIPCGLALTAEKTSGAAPVGFAGKAGSVSGAPRVEFFHQSNTTNEVTPMLAESQKSSGLELAQVAAKSGLPTEHGNTQTTIKNSTAEAGIARQQGPRVYAGWVDDYTDDLWLNSEPAYRQESARPEEIIANVAFAGLLVLAAVCGLAAKFHWFN